VHVLSIGLVSQFFFNQLTGTVLPFNHFHLALGQGLGLSLSNHHINVLCLGLVVLLLLETADLVLLEFLLGGEGSVPSLMFGFGLAIINSSFLFLFALAVLLGFHLLLHSSFLLHLLLLSKSL
jgi:hypothetical protein